MLNLRSVFILLACFFSASARADLELDLRHEASRSVPDSLQQSLLWNQTTGWGGVAVGGRVTQESTQLDRLSYFGEVAYAPFSFFQLEARLHQKVRIEDESGATTWSAVMALCAPGQSVNFCARFGVLRRVWQIDKRAWLPVLYRSSIEETDAMVRFDLGIRLAETWALRWTLGTFENIEVYNLHNPYLQVTLQKQRVWAEADAFLFLRYQALLGFAILGNWTTGLGLKILEI